MDRAKRKSTAAKVPPGNGKQPRRASLSRGKGDATPTAKANKEVVENIPTPTKGGTTTQRTKRQSPLQGKGGARVTATPTEKAKEVVEKTPTPTKGGATTQRTEKESIQFLEIMDNGLNEVLVSECGGAANGGGREAKFASKQQRMNVVAKLFNINRLGGGDPRDDTFDISEVDEDILKKATDSAYAKISSGDGLITGLAAVAWYTRLKTAWTKAAAKRGIKGGDTGSGNPSSHKAALDNKYFFALHAHFFNKLHNAPKFELLLESKSAVVGGRPSRRVGPGGCDFERGRRWNRSIPRK